MRSLTIPSDVTRPFVCYTTKGLADVAEAELRELVPAVTIRERDERFLIAAMTPTEADRVGTLTRVVDDVRMVVAGPAHVRDEDDLDRLCAAAAKEIEATVGGADDSPPWSVTLSARNPPWRLEPVWDPAPVIGRTLHGADPASTGRSLVDVRIQLDGQAAHIAVNLWDHPVGKRPGEVTAPWRGALRPTVAAALVRLAVELGGVADRETGAYDPFCGSGTIVAEAVRRGLVVFASDQSDRAVQLTRDRLAGLGLPPADLRGRVFVRDVRRGPDQRVSARLVVANLPWGKQVKLEGRLALFDATAVLTAHTLRVGGAAALLTTHEEQLMPRLRRHGLTVASRRIGLLGQTPAIVTCHPS